jgi:AcrR family transcriptional regulator
MVRKPSSDRRAEFLSSALKLFAADGEQNTSTAAIAKAAGTAAGTLFLYFPTKQNLIRELILQIGREQSDYIKSLLAPHLSVRETFLTIWVGSVRWFLENMDAYHYYRQVRDSGLVEAAVVQESDKYFSYYYDSIQRGLEKGRIKPYPIEMIGGILYQDINAVMSLIDAQADPAKREEYIQSGFDIFWDGIKTGGD